MNLRALLATLCLGSACAGSNPVSAVHDPGAAGGSARPTIVLAMADDQGWGDIGLRDPRLSTPALDRLFREGVQWDRFYAAAPVCSPTRASVLTGRHPARMGIDGANDGHLPHGELCIAEVLRANGYATGFFGKWHLGTLTRELVDSNRGGRPKHDAHYSPPWEHGFDVVFATEAKVPTFDPMLDPKTGEPYGTRYWTGPGEVVDPSSLGGDDSRIVVRRALGFLADARANGRPAFAVVWLHAPHEPVVASPQRLASMGLDAASQRARYEACLADVDQQVGALAEALHAAAPGGEQPTGVLLFCSDNGPEHAEGPGSTGGLRGRKRDLLEGGIRVPAAVWWAPSSRERLAGFTRGTTITSPASTVDYFSTILDLAGARAELPPLDGVGLLDAARDASPHGYGFRSNRQRAFIAGRWKIHSKDGGSTWALYDIEGDPAETVDLAASESARLAPLVEAFEGWEREVLLDRSDAPGDSR